MTDAKLTGREPTQEMVSAGHKAALRSHADLRYLATMIWMAMHDAAPAAPAKEPDDDRTLCYLIERGQQEGQVPTIYWCLPGMGDYKYGGRWTEDANRAHKFSSITKAMWPLDGTGLSDSVDAPVDSNGEIYNAHVAQHIFLPRLPDAAQGQCRHCGEFRKPQHPPQDAPAKEPK